MFNIFFKKNNGDGADIVVDVDVDTLDELKVKARTKSEEEYKSSLRAEIKKKLYSKYKIESDWRLTMHMAYYYENQLIEAIINDMINSLDLID